MDKLVLVHLSDIHFTRASAVSVHDLDKNVRNELVLDATALASSAMRSWRTGERARS
jgi:hypothetical protein